MIFNKKDEFLIGVANPLLFEQIQPTNNITKENLYFQRYFNRDFLNIQFLCNHTLGVKDFLVCVFDKNNTLVYEKLMRKKYYNTSTPFYKLFFTIPLRDFANGLYYVSIMNAYSESQQAKIYTYAISRHFEITDELYDTVLIEFYNRENIDNVVFSEDIVEHIEADSFIEGFNVSIIDENSDGINDKLKVTIDNYDGDYANRIFAVLQKEGDNKKTIAYFSSDTIYFDLPDEGYSYWVQIFLSDEENVDNYTVYLGYSNFFEIENYTGNPQLISQNRFRMRVDGDFRADKRESKLTVGEFTDEEGDTITTDSLATDTQTLVIGKEGVPFWMVSKLFRIFGMSFISINGNRYNRIGEPELDNENLEKGFYIINAKMQKYNNDGVQLSCDGAMLTDEDYGKYVNEDGKILTL